MNIMCIMYYALFLIDGKFYCLYQTLPTTFNLTRFMTLCKNVDMRIEAAQMRTGFYDSYSIILLFMRGFALRFFQHSFY